MSVVLETLCASEREIEIDATEADAMVSLYAASTSGRYEVRRSWDRVSYSVAVAVRGEVLPFLAYSVGLDD